MKRNQKPEEQSKLENAISYLLISGVLLSLILLIIGMVLLWQKQGGVAVSQDPSVFVQGHDFFSFIYHEVTGGGVKGLPLQIDYTGCIGAVADAIRPGDTLSSIFCQRQKPEVCAYNDFCPDYINDKPYLTLKWLS